MAVPAGVTVKVEGRRVEARGPQGTLGLTLPPLVDAALRDGAVWLTCSEDSAEGRRYHGLVRNLVANMITGVTTGYSKELELQGVGFRAAVQGGNKLTLTLGFSSPVEYVAPAGVVLQVRENIIRVSGPDKQLVGDVAARIRSFCPPEPYKGKGIRYREEHVRRKTGKTVA